LIYKQRWFPPAGYQEKIYGYIRVSHPKQMEGNSPQDQEARISAYVTMQQLEKEHGPFLNADWGRFFTEPLAQSALKKPLKQRPAGEELYEMLRPGDHVVVDKIDRLIRNQLDWLEIDRHFTENGIALHIVNLGGNAINTATAVGRFMLGMFASFAEFESMVKGERVRDARARLRARKLDAGVGVPFFIALEGLPPGKKWGGGAKRVWQPWAKAGLEKIRKLRDEEQLSFYAITKRVQGYEGFKGKSLAQIEYCYWFWSAWLDAHCPDINEIKISEFTNEYKRRRKENG
jgi:DNA invertase Pin-like site-specific DNA recombinase